MVASQMQSYFGSQQQLSSSLFPTNLGNDPAAAYQQQQAPQLQRSISATNQQAAPAALFDEMQRAFRQAASASNASMLFGNNMSGSQSQQPEDIMTRLTQAMQSHGQQQQEKVDEQRRMEQQRRELDIDRLKLAEQMRLQREEDERRRMEIQQQQQQQQKRLEEEMRKKQETSLKNQLLLEQMKEMTKANEQKKPQQQAPAPKSDIDAFLAFTQSVQFQKDQQAKIEAQK